jgi:hypothetical protein
MTIFIQDHRARQGYGDRFSLFASIMNPWLGRQVFFTGDAGDESSFNL